MRDEKKERILSTALEVFFRYGYRRVNMKEIADAAGISRQGLYLYFPSKEDVYREAVEQKAEKLLDEILQGITGKTEVEEKILYAFEIWTIRDFATEIGSPEAREINGYTQSFMNAGFERTRLKFEAIVEKVLSDHYETAGTKAALPPGTISRLIYSSMRGFKLSAKSGEELKQMIRDLLGLILS